MGQNYTFYIYVGLFILKKQKEMPFFYKMHLKNRL